MLEYTVTYTLVKMIIKDIYDFLKKFSNVISDDDKNKFIKIQSHLEYTNNLKTTKNKYGEHFEDCAWSNENTTCGPDTCMCLHYRRKSVEIEEEAKRLLHFYYNIYNISKCKNCNFNNM